MKRLLLTLPLLLPSPVLAATDLTPLFAGYEKGCFVPAAFELFDALTPDHKGKLPPAPANLPAAWMAVAGKPKVSDQKSHWSVSVPLKEATFEGVPATELVVGRGKNNGINYWRMLLRATPEEAREKLRPARFVTDPEDEEIGEHFKAELSAGKRPNEMVVNCDRSM